MPPQTGYDGVDQMLHPTSPIHYPLMNYIVLGASFLFEGVSWWFGLKAFRATKGSQTYAEAFRRSKDPTTFIVVFEDTAALAGLLIAAVGIAAAHALDAPRLDGVASIGIALVLLVSSLLLVRETKALLVGEAAHAHLRDAILRIAGEDPGVHHANGVLAVQLGPDQVVAALSLQFHEALTQRRSKLRQPHRIIDLPGLSRNRYAVRKAAKHGNLAQRRKRRVYTSSRQPTGRISHLKWTRPPNSPLR